MTLICNDYMSMHYCDREGPCFWIW